MADLLSDTRLDDWIPATDLVSGARLEELFALPQQLWAAPPHTAAVLAWKAYTYGLIRPLAAAWTSSRQVPVLSADNVRVRVQPTAPYIVVELIFRRMFHADVPEVLKKSGQRCRIAAVVFVAVVKPPTLGGAKAREPPR